MPLGPIITLTTDFGTSDHFAGVMKGVVARIAPNARVVDITHQITPYEILEGAFVIAETWKHFPKSSIHVVIVDPGVGSARRPILAAAGGHYFIAPDNGVLSMIFDAAKAKVRVISNPKMMAREISHTFHGRDIFAPAAAHLAKGAAPSRFGTLIEDHVRIDGIHPSMTLPNVWHGQILQVDRFGNLITNFDARALPRLSKFELRVGKRRIHRLALTFSEAAIGALVLVAGSSGYLEIVANQRSAAQMLGCGVRSPVELEIYDAERS
jgi:S-adenosylmethionine hydrolase